MPVYRDELTKTGGHERQNREAENAFFQETGNSLWKTSDFTLDLNFKIL